MKKSRSKVVPHFAPSRSWEYENGFYLTTPVNRLAKALAQYELYKKITELPGVVVECGVYKGASFVRWCTFRQLLENSCSRKVVGFDAFGNFPIPVGCEDRAFVERFEAEGGIGIGVDELRRCLEHKGFNNFELEPGDIVERVPAYVRAHPELKIALLHVDVDVYEATRVVLEGLYGRVVRGGLVVLDDYGTVAGATRAADDFLAHKGVQFEKLSIAHIPVYIRRE